MKPRMRDRRQTAAILVEPLESRVLMSAVPNYTFVAPTSFQIKTTGAHPQGLVADTLGNLYGVTTTGGTKGYGTLFKVAVGSSTITKIADFTGTNGLSPRGNLVIDGGNLYGVTVGGGTAKKGTIFKFSLTDASPTIVTLASFDGTNGAYPMAGLVIDASGNLYGEAMGAIKRGYATTVWELPKVGAAFGPLSALATFNYKDELNSTLVVDSAGNVFGTTNLGGAKKRGSVFEIVAGSHTVTTLASFQGTYSGYQPQGTLVAGTDGSLIGVTLAGGTKGYGTVFKVTLGGGSATITTLANFTSTNGRSPTGSLVVDSSGTLFGVTAAGGKYGVGTVFALPDVFSLTANAGTITTLVPFRNSLTGAYPTGALVLKADGSLWGTTDLGGTDQSGRLFSLTPTVSPPPST